MKTVFLILFVGILGISIGYQSMNIPVVTDDLMLENVEALANYEEYEIPIRCEGPGDYVCPLNGEKFGYIYKGFGLRK